ncbi:hypothetical protein QOT17_000733 [Balamuthia mandrillaris]
MKVNLVYMLVLEKFDQPSETPNLAWLSLFKREWPNAFKECALSDSHGATAKYSTLLSHVLTSTLSPLPPTRWIRTAAVKTAAATMTPSETP